MVSCNILPPRIFPLFIHLLVWGRRERKLVIRHQPRSHVTASTTGYAQVGTMAAPSIFAHDRIRCAKMNSRKFTRDFLCEFKHIWEVGMSFAEYATQRLDIAKFPRIIGERSERERERERGPAPGPSDSPNLELCALLGGFKSPFSQKSREHTLYS